MGSHGTNNMKTKLKRFKTLKEFERQIPERLSVNNTIPLTSEEIQYYYHNLLGIDIPRHKQMTFHGYQIVESVV